MHYVIIGGCAAGLNAIEGIRKIDQSGEITLISKEKYPPYARCLITNYLIGTHSEKSLYLRDNSFYKKNNVNLILEKEVKKILPDEKKVYLSDKEKISYDKILIATGSSPKKLGIKGEEKEGISVFRTIDDVKKILQRIEKSKKVLVFGGGLIGLKAGYSLKKKGLEVEIIIKSPQILSQVVDKKSAKILSNWLNENGIKIRTGLEPVEILGNKEMEEVLFDNGEKIKAQIGIVGKGVSPNLSVIENTDIKTHWGIIVDDYLRTSNDDIFSAGDVTETKDLITGNPTINALWLSAQEQGKTAGINMAGGKKKYPGSIGANAAEFFGLPFISFGKTRETENVEIKEICDEKNYIYKRFVLKSNILIGAVFIGDVKSAGLYMSLIRSKSNLENYKNILGKEWFNYGKVRELLEKDEGFRESISPEGNNIFFT